MEFFLNEYQVKRNCEVKCYYYQDNNINNDYPPLPNPNANANANSNANSNGNGNANSHENNNAGP